MKIILTLAALFAAAFSLSTEAEENPNHELFYKGPRYSKSNIRSYTRNIRSSSYGPRH